jgi:hypothetical protein
MGAGFVTAAIGLLLGLAAMIGGGTPGVLTFGAVLLGVILTVIGFAQRLLAAVERR